MTPAAWAVLDAEDVVRDVFVSRDVAAQMVTARERETGGGFRVAPLTLADLDVVDAIADQRAAAVTR